MSSVELETKGVHEYTSTDVNADGARDGTENDQQAVLAPEIGELAPGEAVTGGLGRHLGIWSTTSLIIGRIIGTGIFSTPSSITESVNSVGAAIMLWLLGGFISFAGLCIWLELSCMIPRSGGEKVFLEAAYKRPKLLATVFFAFQAVLLGFTASGCIVFSEYIWITAGATATEWEKRGIAIVVLVAITLVHTIFPRIGVSTMNTFAVMKVVMVLFIIVSGWVVLSGRVKSIPDPNASFRNSFAGSSHSSYQYATALFSVLNSYAGWSNASYVLNEVKNPIRTIKIAGPLGLGICTIMYLLANVSYYAAATPAEVAASGVTVASLFMDKVFGEGMRRAFSFFIALSAFGNVMTITFAQSRVNQELAKEGVIPFPRFWASSWPTGAPSAGLLLHFIPSFIVIIAVPFGDAYDFIIDLEGYPGSIVDLLVVVGLFWLRYAEPNLHRPFRCWYPVAAFYLVCQAFLVVAPFIKPPGGATDDGLPYYLYLVVGIAVLATGVIYWAVWRKILPAIGRYQLVPVHYKLQDGTHVVVYEKDKQA